MSDKLSAKLLNEINNSICATNAVEEADLQMIGEIEVIFEWIPGLRQGSKLLWAYEEENLYYANSYSKKTKITACTCIEPKCNARWYSVQAKLYTTPLITWLFLSEIHSELLL